MWQWVPLALSCLCLLPPTCIYFPPCTPVHAHASHPLMPKPPGETFTTIYNTTTTFYSPYYPSKSARGWAYKNILVSPPPLSTMAWAGVRAQVRCFSVSAVYECKKVKFPWLQQIECECPHPHECPHDSPSSHRNSICRSLPPPKILEQKAESNY